MSEPAVLTRQDDAPLPRPPARRRRRFVPALARTTRRYPQPWTALGALALWEVIAHTVQPNWLPTVESVAAAWWDLASGGRFDVFLTTLRTLGIGLLIVFVVGAAISALFAASRYAEAVAQPFVNAVLTTPMVALIPAFILVWGYSDLTRVVTVVAFALFPVVVTWTVGLKDAPRELLEMAYSFKASRRRRVVSVLLPAAAPVLLTGVRIGVVQGIKGVVSAEVLIGVVGVGRLIQEANLSFDQPRLYAVILTLLALSIVSYFVLDYFERRLARRSNDE